MSTAPRDAARERFETLSRQAAAGTISATDRAWFDAWIADHPDARPDIEWDTAFAAQLERKIDAMPAMPGWARTEQALREDRIAHANAGRGLLDRLTDWFESLTGARLNLQAIAAALVLAQAGVIGTLVWQARDAGHEAVRSSGPDNVITGPVLRVSFRPDVRESDLRQALADIGGDIVAGPGQLGIYLVRVHGNELAAAAERLRQSGLTELVEIHTPRP